MFDGSLPGPAAVTDASDAELIDAISGWARAAASAEARKFAALAEWHRRASARPLLPRAACDDTDNAAAQVACALTISHGRAQGLMETAVKLRDHLPKLGRLFVAGEVSERVLSRIMSLTSLVDDDAVWDALDEQFAETAAGWGVLSGDKLDTAIKVWIHTYDPDAIRRVPARLRDRDFVVGKHDDETATTSVYGRVHSVDAALAAQRIAAMVAGVCDDDPRTLPQRRADAFGAVFAGVFDLACRCGGADCPAAQRRDARASSVVVHVVADHAALHAQPDPSIHGEAAAQPARDTSPPPAETRPAHDAGPAPTPETDANPETETVPAPAAPSTPRPAAVIPALRGTILPAALLAELIADGATVRVVADPDSLSTCAGYRPSTALAEFVRARDLTCRVPGCDRPAVHADLDHSNPWPGGPTHPGNTNCKCRLHHLLKTFWEGWTEQQLPDGTLRITTPTGHTYTTKPFSALLFPTWRTTTPPPPQSGQPAPPPSPGRALMMPTRRRTREQAKAAYITRERRLNALQRELDRAAAEQAAQQHRAKAAAEREAKPPRPSPDLDDRFPIRPPGYQPDYGDDPPPF